MADSHWAANVESVHRVHPQLSIHKVPGTHPWFAGLAQMDGELLSVTDLGCWLSTTPCHGPVLQLQKNLGAIGLRVDEVFGAEALQIEAHTLSANDAMMPGALAQTVAHNGRQYRVLEFQWLVQSPAFVAIRKARTV